MSMRSSGSLGEAARAEHSGASLLVVDDDVGHRERLAKELGALGWWTAIESKPEETLNYVRSRPPEWSCVEPALPGVSWLHFLRQFANACVRTRWVVVTAFPSSALAVEAMKLGAYDVLTKPVTGGELANVCRGQVAHPSRDANVDLSLAKVEWEHLNKVLRLCAGNVSEASRRLGIPRQTLYNKLRKMP